MPDLEPVEAPMSDMVFSVDALEANRSGRLSAEQTRELEAGLDRKHSGLSGFVGRRVDPLVKDVDAGAVETTQGAITKLADPMAYGRSSAYHYRVEIGNREAGGQQYRSPADIYEYAPEAGMVRAYYLPRSRMIVNLERLPEAPADLSREAAEEKLKEWAEAKRAHDKVGEAEQRAQVAALERQTVGPAPDASATPARTGQEALAEAIVGGWENPLMRVTFQGDGTLTTHLPDGSDLEGRWSVDPGGRLNADVMGTPMVAEASVEADRLTLVIEGQRMTLQRSA